jgi:Cu2+-exporting ATPase
MLTCCPVGPAIDAATQFAGDLVPWVTSRPDGSRELDLIIPGLCSPESIPLIEGALEAIPGLATARVNFTGKRVITTWNDPSFIPTDISEKLNELGFISRPFDPSH